MNGVIKLNQGAKDVTSAFDLTAFQDVGATIRNRIYKNGKIMIMSMVCKKLEDGPINIACPSIYAPPEFQTIGLLMNGSNYFPVYNNSQRIYSDNSFTKNIQIRGTLIWTLS